MVIVLIVLGYSLCLSLYLMGFGCKTSGESGLVSVLRGVGEL